MTLSLKHHTFVAIFVALLCAQQLHGVLSIHPLRRPLKKSQGDDFHGWEDIRSEYRSNDERGRVKRTGDPASRDDMVDHQQTEEADMLTRPGDTARSSDILDTEPNQGQVNKAGITDIIQAG